MYLILMSTGSYDSYSEQPVCVVDKLTDARNMTIEFNRLIVKGNVRNAAFDLYYDGNSAHRYQVLTYLYEKRMRRVLGKIKDKYGLRIEISSWHITENKNFIYKEVKYWKR